MKKKIKVTFEIPSNYLTEDEADMLSLLGRTYRDHFEYLIRDQIVEKLQKEIEIPDIKVTPEEIKDKLLTILAERALDQNENNS